MATPHKENQENIQKKTLSNKYQQHLTPKKVIWFSVAVFGIYLYFDDVLREEVKDVLWAIIY